MIEGSDLRKVYRIGSTEIKAVDGVNLSVNDGDLVTIVGRSGSGKTTLLCMLGGLTKPTFGTVKLYGKDVWSLTDSELSTLRGERIGFVFQFSGLLPTLTCVENVALPHLFVHRTADAIARAHGLLDEVGLSERANSYPAQLSGGELKRAAVARSLMNDPSVVLADEPTGDLDVDTERELMEFFVSINKKGKTIVIVTHNPALAAYGKRFLKMERGKLLEEGQ